MPSLYFNYHVGGFAVALYPLRNRLTNFLYTLFAVLGGIYTIASFVDNMLNQYIGSKHQYELIK